MDKKAKKKLSLLRQKLQKLQQQLAGAKKQDDTPGEIARLEQEAADLESEITKLKES